MTAGRALKRFGEWLTGMRTIRAERGEMRAPTVLLGGLAQPERFVANLGRMHAAMEDLFGLPTGNRDRVILAHEEGQYGALWAYADAGPGHHIGVPAVSWPNTVAAANRRAFISPLVHEMGHVAFWWDWDRGVHAHYLMWPGAVEGFATPTGTYACWKYGEVPAWSDDPSGTHDWATLEDWVNQWINQGLDAVAEGARGQDSVTQAGHGAGAAIIEAVLFDLIFYQLGGYDAFREVCRTYVRELRTREQAAKSDQEKMESFFTRLGLASGRNLSGYLAAWGFEVPEGEMAHLPKLAAELPPRREIHYGVTA